MMALISNGDIEMDRELDHKYNHDHDPNDDDKQPEISTIPVTSILVGEDGSPDDDDGNDGDISSTDAGDSGYGSDDEIEIENEPVSGPDKSFEPALTKRISGTFNISANSYAGGAASPSSFSSPFRRMLSPPLPLFTAYKSREVKPPKTMGGMRFLQHGPTHIHWHPPELEPLQILTPNEHIYLTEQYKRDLYRQIPTKLVVYDSVYTYEELDAMGATTGAQMYSVLNPGYNNQPMKTGAIKSSFYTPKGLHDNTLVFESRFETGNLRRAVQLDEFEYDLMLRPDIKTDFHTQWFYFCVTNTRAQAEYRFNIINHGKSESMFSKGMRPLMYSVKAAAERGKGWVRVGHRICYYPNHFKFHRKKKAKGYNTLSFTITTEYAMDAVYFAMCYPYTYTDLGRYLKGIEEDPKKRVYMRRRTLCRTLAGNDCDMLTITHFDSDHEEIAARKAVVATARVHPGETNASWMMKGMIDFLLGESREAVILRKNFIFKIVPMLNPDGVIHGNYRCSLAGVDLNRNWMNPSKALHPTVYHTKEMIRRVAETRQLLMCVDLHGHSTKSNIFCYGCDNKHDRHIRNTERVFPRMLWDNNSNVFSFADCSFNMSKSKRSTQRLVLRNEIGLINSYTCEASFAGSTTGPNAGNHFTMLHLQRMGYLWGRCILDYCNPEKRAKTLDGLELLETQMPADIAMRVDSDDGSGGSSDDDDDDGVGLGLGLMGKRRRKRKKKKKKKEDEKNSKKKNQKSGGSKGNKQEETAGKRKGGKLKQKVKTIIKMKRPINRMTGQNKKAASKNKRAEKESNSTSVTVSEGDSSVTVTVTVITETLERSQSTAVVKPSPQPPQDAAKPSATTKRRKMRNDGPDKTQKRETKGNRAWTEKEKSETKKTRGKPAGGGRESRKPATSNTINRKSSVASESGKAEKTNSKTSRKKSRKKSVTGGDKVVGKKKKVKKKATGTGQKTGKKASKAANAAKAKAAKAAAKAAAIADEADDAGDVDDGDDGDDFAERADNEVKFEYMESHPEEVSEEMTPGTVPGSPPRYNVRRVWAGTHGGMGKNSAEFTSELQVAERAGSPSALSRELVSATMTEDAAIHEMMDEANRGVVFRQPHASFLSGHSPAGEAPITSFVSSPSSGRRASQPTVTIREGDPSVIGYLGRRRAGSTSAASSIRPGSVDSYYSGSRPRTPSHMDRDALASTIHLSESYLATSMGNMSMAGASQPIFPAISPSRGAPTFSPSSTNNGSKFF